MVDAGVLTGANCAHTIVTARVSLDQRSNSSKLDIVQPALTASFPML